MAANARSPKECRDSEKGNMYTIQKRFPKGANVSKFTTEVVFDKKQNISTEVFFSKKGLAHGKVSVSDSKYWSNEIKNVLLRE